MRKKVQDWGSPWASARRAIAKKKSQIVTRTLTIVRRFGREVWKVYWRSGLRGGSDLLCY